MSNFNEKVGAAFIKAKRINEAIWDGADAGHLSIDRLKTIIADLYAVEIVLLEVNFKGDHLRGMIEVYNGGRTAKVYIRAKQHDLWKRFVAVKELCHVIIDKREDWSSDGVETLEKLIVGDVLDLQSDNAFLSERLAEVVAHELVYPHEHRRDDLARVQAGEVKPNDLALKFGIPVEIIQRVLSQSYLSMCDVFWRSVTIAERAAGAAAE
jgi:Zn-dependent peptidase ImmA (M78 family)